MAQAADTDGSGQLSKDELANVVTMLQLAEDKHSLESMMTGMDLDNNAKIDLWEFCVYLHRSRTSHRSDIAVIHEDEWKLQVSLELFDANKDGWITREEIMQASARLPAAKRRHTSRASAPQFFRRRTLPSNFRRRNYARFAAVRALCWNLRQRLRLHWYRHQC